MTSPFDNKVMRYKEETDRGDVAKSLQELIKAHFISKSFKDIMGATRLQKREVYIISIMEIWRITSKILSIRESDIKSDNLTEGEREELKELYQLKQRFQYNPLALSYAIYDSFEYMFGLGLQSLDGLSRMEGVEISSGAVHRLMSPDDMGFLEKTRKRLFGKVLYPE